MWPKAWRPERLENKVDGLLLDHKMWRRKWRWFSGVRLEWQADHRDLPSHVRVATASCGHRGTVEGLRAVVLNWGWFLPWEHCTMSGASLAVTMGWGERRGSMLLASSRWGEAGVAANLPTTLRTTFPTVKSFPFQMTVVPRLRNWVRAVSHPIRSIALGGLPKSIERSGSSCRGRRS